MGKLAGCRPCLKDDDAIRGMGVLGQHDTQHRQARAGEYDFVVLDFMRSDDRHQFG
jgi:hypothetical protein